MWCTSIQGIPLKCFSNLDGSTLNQLKYVKIELNIYYFYDSCSILQ